MARVRRRRTVDRYQPDIGDEQRDAMRLRTECGRARFARMVDERQIPAQVPPAWRRSDDWWRDRPGIEPIVRYRELAARGAIRWDEVAHHVTIAPR